MKKQFLQITFLALAISGIVTSCKDDADTSAPSITLTGRNPDSLAMLTTYSDLGATAQDDKDGNISSSILVDDTDIENELPGTYQVYYSVSDAAGNNADAQRSVVVYANPSGLAKNYNVKDTCGTGASAIWFNYSQQPIAFSSTQIKFNRFADYDNNTNIVATISRDGTITLPSQTALNIGNLSEDHVFQGTGYVTPTGFYLEYTDQNNSAVPVSTASCRAYFTRL